MSAGKDFIWVVSRVQPAPNPHQLQDAHLLLDKMPETPDARTINMDPAHKVHFLSTQTG